MENKLPRAVLSIVVIVPILIGCDVSSSETPASETTIDGDLIVDGVNDTMVLEVFLSARRADISLPIAFEGGDHLTLDQLDQSSRLVENSDNRRYSVTVSPVSNDPYTLVYSRTSGDEIIQSTLSVPFSISAFSAQFNTEGSILSVWDIGGPGGTVDPANFPISAFLISTPVTCIDNSGEEVAIESGISRSFRELNKDDIASGEAINNLQEIVSSHPYLIDDLGYVSCSFDIQLTATWRNTWDGLNEPVGVNGPVWIRPSAIFANEVLPVAEQEIFDITVNSDTLNLLINF